MARKRWKRKSGYVTPDKTMSIKDMEKYDLFLTPFYDDWMDWRDGMRDWFSDFKLIKNINPNRSNYIDDKVITKRLRMNKKQKILLKRRKIKKLKWKML